jgi:hypothetical protein
VGNTITAPPTKNLTLSMLALSVAVLVAVWLLPVLGGLVLQQVFT